MCLLIGWLHDLYLLRSYCFARAVGGFLVFYVFARSVGCVVLLVVLLCWLLPGPTFIGEVLSVFFIFLELVRALGPCILWLGSALLEINS